MLASGTVVSLHRWPVKSMGGEHDLPILRLDGRGVAGDRAHALFDVHRGAPRRLTVRQVPRLLLWAARYPSADIHPNDVPAAQLAAPGGQVYGWADPDLAHVLSEDLGRPVTLGRDLALQQDLADSVLVITTATHAAVGAALGRELDLRRWRTNVVVSLDAPAFAEEGWEGRVLQIGEAKLRLLHPCERCVIPTRDPDSAGRNPEILRWLARERRTLFGMNARALLPAAIRPGDAVRVT